ncbi:UNVERIFIED_CONTAM: hypothetical protein FKN15_039470 [Acipenser sinensis]
MAKTSEIINLSFLLDNEKEIILGVLQKDENLRKLEEKRIRQLRVVTGEWFFEERSKRFIQGNSQGSEVVKQSIARAPPGKSKAEKVNLKAQSDQNGQERSVTPTSTRSALRNVIDASRHRGLRAEKKGSRLTLGNGNNLDPKPEDSRSIGSASDLDAHSVHSTHSASRSARGGIAALESSGMQTMPNNLRSSTPGKSPTLSKRSAASGYSRRADGAESVSSFHCSESFTDNSNRNHRKSCAAPSIAISRASLSSAKKSFLKGKKGNIQLPTGGVVEVQIKEAKNLTAVKSGGTSDTFVKG